MEGIGEAVQQSGVNAVAPLSQASHFTGMLHHEAPSEADPFTPDEVPSRAESPDQNAAPSEAEPSEPYSEHDPKFLPGKATQVDFEGDRANGAIDISLLSFVAATTEEAKLKSGHHLSVYTQHNRQLVSGMVREQGSREGMVRLPAVEEEGDAQVRADSQRKPQMKKTNSIKELLERPVHPASARVPAFGGDESLDASQHSSSSSEVFFKEEARLFLGGGGCD